jgi:hypothetical protein
LSVEKEDPVPGLGREQQQSPRKPQGAYRRRLLKELNQADDVPV